MPVHIRPGQATEGAQHVQEGDGGAAAARRQVYRGWRGRVGHQDAGASQRRGLRARGADADVCSKSCFSKHRRWSRTRRRDSALRSPGSGTWWCVVATARPAVLTRAGLRLLFSVDWGEGGAGACSGRGADAGGGGARGGECLDWKGTRNDGYRGCGVALGFDSTQKAWENELNTWDAFFICSPYI